MQGKRATIFRNEALEHYIQSGENDTLPRITRPPIFLCMWMLLGICATALAVVCLCQVPIYASGSGVVLERDSTVLVFVPTSVAHPLSLRAGAPVRVSIGTPAQIINSTVDRVEPSVLSPDDVQKRYGLGDKISQIIAGPSIVVSIKLDATFPLKSYAGSVVNVQIQVGTTRVLSLLLGSALPNGE